MMAEFGGRERSPSEERITLANHTSESRIFKRICKINKKINKKLSCSPHHHVCDKLALCLSFLPEFASSNWLSGHPLSSSSLSSTLNFLHWALLSSFALSYTLDSTLCSSTSNFFALSFQLESLPIESPTWASISNLSPPRSSLQLDPPTRSFLNLYPFLPRAPHT